MLELTRRNSLFPLASSILLAAVTGCHKAPAVSPLMKRIPGVQVTSAQLRLKVHAFSDLFSATVEDAADQIIEASPDPAVRREALIWKVNVIPEIQRAAFQIDPAAGLLDLWALSVQMHRYFLSGGGRDLFGPAQPIAVEASKSLETAIEDLARSVRADGDVSEGRRLIDDWVTTHPMRGNYRRESPRGELAQWAGVPQGAFASIQSLDEGVGDLSNRLAIYAQSFPGQARWQLELLLDDYEVLDKIDTVTRNVATISAGAESVAGTLEGLPDLVRGERAAMLDALSDQIAVIDGHVEAHRLATIEALSAERVAALDAVHAERVATLEEISRERTATMEELRSIVTTAIDDSFSRADALVDRIFVRLAILVAALVLALLLLGAAALRRGRALL